MKQWGFNRPLYFGDKHMAITMKTIKGYIYHNYIVNIPSSLKPYAWRVVYKELAIALEELDSFQREIGFYDFTGSTHDFTDNELSVVYQTLTALRFDSLEEDSITEKEEYEDPDWAYPHECILGY
jgi:hypothetical protein